MINLNNSKDKESIHPFKNTETKDLIASSSILWAVVKWSECEGAKH
jgi:hypothetical protein